MLVGLGTEATVLHAQAALNRAFWQQALNSAPPAAGGFGVQESHRPNICCPLLPPASTNAPWRLKFMGGRWAAGAARD